MASNGSRGTDFERQCRAALEVAGFTVIRSAASKTGVDLVALGKPDCPRARGVPVWNRNCGEVWLVQCKRDGRLDPGEWNTLVDLAWDCNSEPVLACREKVDGRFQAVFYVLTEQRTPRSRTWPKRRVEVA